MPTDYLSTRGYYGQDPVGTRLREIVQGRLGGSQMRGASLAAGQQAQGIAQANTANPALAARQASQASAASGAQIADAESRQRMAAQQTALGLLEARRREEQQFAQRMLGGVIGAGSSLLGMVVPGLGGAAGTVGHGLGQALGSPAGQALGNPAGPAPRAPSTGETSFHGYSAGMAGTGIPGYFDRPTNAWNLYAQPGQPPAQAPLGGGVPEPVFDAPATPQSAMPAERQGQQSMMRPTQSTMLSTGQPGQYIPPPSPVPEGSAMPEQPPALPPYAARLAGQAPVQGALSPGQLRVEPRPLTAVEELLESYYPGLGRDPYSLLGLIPGAR